MSNKPQQIIVHHSVTPRDLNKDITENSFNNSHKARGFPASYFQGKEWFIGYHYVIYGDGEVRQYRDESTVGAHCKEQEMNYKSLGICLVGDFDKEEPSEAQLYSLDMLITQIMQKYSIPREHVVPHRKYATYKSCWGNTLPDDVMEYLDARTKPHWSHDAFEWAKKHELITVERDPNTPVLWGEFITVLFRLSVKLTEWLKPYMK